MAFAAAGIEVVGIDISPAMLDMARDSEIRYSMAQFGSTTATNTPEEFAKDLQEETSRWAKYLNGVTIK